MALRIDPSVPHVWRSPSSVQFGVDRPTAVLESVSNADERMLEALLRGVPRSALTVIAGACGVAESDVDTLLAALTPVLLADGAEPRRSESGSRRTGDPHVVVDGDGPFAASVGALLAAEGVHVRRGSDWRDDERVDLAVIVCDYVVAPERYGVWLRRDIPHLVVVAGDTTVRVGPLVEPGLGPCLYCLDLARRDQDAAWPAMASQLLEQHSPVDSALLVAEAAATAARAAIARLESGRSDLASSSRVIDAVTGTVSVLEHRPHAECGCRALQENVTALGHRRAAGRSAPSSTAAPHALG